MSTINQAYVYQVGEVFLTKHYCFDVIEKKGSIAMRIIMDQDSQLREFDFKELHPKAKVFQVITYTDYDVRLKQYLKSFSN
ncbi:hypothetical protein [Empedobacter falsenii]